MKKSTLLLALNALEVKLLEERQNYKRQRLNDEVEHINRLLEETRQNIEEVSIYSPNKINLK
jgi:hypothetical protein|tara:strand:+ start:116 stop:301 length:186 start_codon:yes stop_codon:yes gene_type:complete